MYPNSTPENPRRSREDILEQNNGDQERFFIAVSDVVWISDNTSGLRLGNLYLTSRGLYLIQLARLHRPGGTPGWGKALAGAMGGLAGAMAVGMGDAQKEGAAEHDASTKAKEASALLWGVSLHRRCEIQSGSVFIATDALAYRTGDGAMVLTDQRSGASVVVNLMEGNVSKTLQQTLDDYRAGRLVDRTESFVEEFGIGAGGVTPHAIVAALESGKVASAVWDELKLIPDNPGRLGRLLSALEALEVHQRRRLIANATKLPDQTRDVMRGILAVRIGNVRLRMVAFGVPAILSLSTVLSAIGIGLVSGVSESGTLSLMIVAGGFCSVGFAGLAQPWWKRLRRLRPLLGAYSAPAAPLEHRD